MIKLTNLTDRGIAKARNLLVQKKMIKNEPGGGGSKSKWSFNKDWEQWITPEQQFGPELEGPPNKSVVNPRTTVGGTPELEGTLFVCKPMSHKEQLAPKDNIKDNKSNQVSSIPALRDEAYDLFEKLFTEKMGSPYMKCKGDFVQLSALRKSFKLNGKETPPDWEISCKNYLDSPMGSFSIQYMVTGNRYAVLRKFKLNQYGKPDKNGGNNGTSELPLGEPGSTSDQRNSRGERLYIPKTRM